MRGPALLQRIQTQQLGSARSTPTDGELSDAVLGNLRTMFRTRVGSALACPGYGISCVTEILHACPEASDGVVDTIVNTIREHEPRLTDVSVRVLPDSEADPLTISFEIDAYIVHGRRRVPVKYHTVIDGARRLDVRARPQQP